MSAGLPASRTIFLLGAGASNPVGLPTIDKMTEDFKKDLLENDRAFLPESAEESEKNLGILERVCGEYYGKVDLEYLMTLMMQLQDSHSKALFEAKYPQLKAVDSGWVGIIRFRINSYIRERLEEIGRDSIRYLWPMQGFMTNNERLQIFTLNYDATIEMSCELAGIPYSDGFDPEWNPGSFQNRPVNIYKLHGSLYWLRTSSGKIIKVP